MPSFEEDAFTRAQQMHRRTPYRPGGNQQTDFQKREPKPEPEPEPEPNQPEKAQSPNVTVSQQNDGLLDMLFKNKEQNLILLLIILLMEENSDPTLLLALIYLLI